MWKICCYCDSIVQMCLKLNLRIRITYDWNWYLKYALIFENGRLRNILWFIKNFKQMGSLSNEIKPGFNDVRVSIEIGSSSEICIKVCTCTVYTIYVSSNGPLAFGSK